MTKLLANLKIGRKLGLLLGSGLAVLSQQSGASPALKGVNHVWTGRVVIHERSVGIQRSSSNTLTARRCEVFSSGAIITVARRPGPPVVVRTRVARISARSLI